MLSFGLLLFVVNAWFIPWFRGKTLTGTEIAVYAGTSALGGDFAALTSLDGRLEAA